MAEAAAQEAIEKKPVAAKKKRVMTFVFTNGEEVQLGKHKTNAFSTDKAWEEFVAKHNLNDESKMVGALPGLLDWIPKGLRKPSKTEMEEMLKANNLL